MKVHVSHVPLWALLAVMTLLAWQGWHRPVLRVTAPALQQGQQQEVGEVVAGQRIKESAVGLGSGRDRITAPPAVVSAAEQQRAAASAAISAVIHRDRECVHPDNSAPDPTCGKPLQSDTLAVWNGKAFVVVQTPAQSAESRVAYTVTEVRAASAASRGLEVRLPVFGYSLAIGPYYGVEISQPLGLFGSDASRWFVELDRGDRGDARVGAYFTWKF